MNHYIVVILSIVGYYARSVRAECDAANEISVQIDSGWLCGRRWEGDDNVTYAGFRGVGYAEQPVGPYRFSELRKKLPWEGYFNASVEGPICPQVDVYYGKLVYPNRTMSEECIHANVHVPLVNSTADLSCQSGLPILVFFHGGGFSTGSGDADILGPEYFVSKGVIVISINYRLNVFGFLSLDSAEIPGNAGLRDAMTALKWVKANAEAFGGNPHNVTLVGQSAGAALVHLLSLSNATEGLFNRIIMMSGTGNPGIYSASKAAAKYAADLYLAQLGINSTDTAYIHKTLTEMPLATIMESYEVFQDAIGLGGFAAVIESPFENVTMILDADPKTLVKQGRGNQYPLMLGLTSDETVAFENRITNLEIVDNIKNNTQLVLAPKYVYDIPTNLSLKFAAETLQRYFSDVATLEEFIVCSTDSYFKYPAFDLARMRAATDGAKVYMYYFSYHSDQYQGILAKAINLTTNYEGAIHLEDMLYIFKENVLLGGQNSITPTAKDDQMRDWMTELFVNFMRCSDPSCSGGSLWEPVSSTNLTYVHIEEPYKYNNTNPTQDQQDMIEFFDFLEAQYEDAQSSSS